MSTQTIQWYSTRLANNTSSTRTTLQSLPPLSLYIHIPWCVKKCPYCDFNSHTVRDTIPEAAYVHALIQDLEQALPLIWGRRVQSIFFGGGTPSLFSAKAIDQILQAVRARVPLAPDAEITLEANPGTVETGQFAGYQAAGVNRLSLGIQSFAADKLQALGRIHSSTEAHRAIEQAQTYFKQVNMDLMYALPNQTLTQALQDVETALSYRPNHLSVYHLTLEPNTAFYQNPPDLPDGEIAADMQEAIEEKLASTGYQHYETSAFCQPNAQAKHNLNYWQFGDYLGIGAGAHSKISFHDRIIRQVRFKQPQTYLQNSLNNQFIQAEHAITQLDLPFEFMMNALRLNQGVPLAMLTERTSLTLEAFEPALSQAIQKGLLHPFSLGEKTQQTISHAIIKPTLKGQRFLNDLVGLFL